jgi:hypothetical protein
LMNSQGHCHRTSGADVRRFALKAALKYTNPYDTSG